VTVKREVLLHTQQSVIGRGIPSVPLFYARIMVSTILERLVAFTERGFSAGIEPHRLFSAPWFTSGHSLCFAFNSLY